MDVNGLKGRIAEALVEGMLRRAGYQVALTGREGRVQHLLKIGRDAFSPDFLVWKALERADTVWPLHRLVGVEVKYRSDISGYLGTYFPAEFARVAQQWPDLYCVLVTDHPEEGRSCFQAIHLRQYAPDRPPVALDLHAVSDLDIYRTNVAEHEALVKQIFPLLSSELRSNGLSRTPAAKEAGEVPPLPIAR
jgi:hypothetical protein